MGYPPSRVDVFASEDGKAFKPAGTAKFAVPQEQGPSGSSVKEIVIEASGAGRYVKVFCKNNGLLPAWHKAPGVLEHLMTDEILMNPDVAR